MSAWLAAAYALLVLGCGWAVASTGGWVRRLPLLVCGPLLAVGLWLAVPDVSGYPTREAVPAHAVFVYGVVDEPDPSAGDPGRIFLWLDVGTGAPRAYSLPYSRQLHREVQAALNAAKHGVQVGVARARPGRGPSGHGQQRGRQRSPLRFYSQPPGLPPKHG